MLKIRLFRVGKKNQPSFKIVVTDKRKPPAGGRFVEEVGFWNPLTKEKILKGERVKYWMSVGAKPSNTVYNLLIQSKILEGKKTPVHKKKKEKPGTKAEPGAGSVPHRSTESEAGVGKTEEPKETKPEETKTKEAKIEEVRAEKIEKEEPKKEEKEARSEEVKSEEVKSEDVKPEEQKEVKEEKKKEEGEEAKKEIPKEEKPKESG